MNIAYIIALTDTNLLTSESSGIKKKIDWQVSALNRAGVETHIIKKEILPKVKRAFPFHSSIIDWYGLLEDMVQKYDGMYHRHVYTDYHMLSFFKKLKKIKPDFKIILELPTYPYDQERRKNLLYYRDWIFAWLGILSTGMVWTGFCRDFLIIMKMTGLRIYGYI